VHDQRARVEADQDVFRAPLDGSDPLAADRRFEVGWNGPAQAALAHDEIDDVRTLESRRDAGSGRFYFGEFRRETSRTSST
jgi:hypothetical protein